MRFYSSRLAVSALVVSIGLGTGQAFAADADEIAKALVAAFTTSGKSEASQPVSKSWPSYSVV